MVDIIARAVEYQSGLAVYLELLSGVNNIAYCVVSRVKEVLLCFGSVLAACENDSLFSAVQLDLDLVVLAFLGVREIKLYASAGNRWWLCV